MSTPSRWNHLDTLHDVLAVAAHDAEIVAALDDGRVLRSTDGGISWQAALAQPVGTPVTLLVTDEACWTGTTTGVVRAARSEGWAAHPGRPPHVVVTALAARGETAVAGTLRAGVFRSSDAGLTWEPSRLGLPLGGERLRVYDAIDAPHGLVVAHALGMSLSRDGGVSWQPAATGLPLRIPYATLASDGKRLYAGVGGHLYRAASPAKDGASLSWTEIHDGTDRPLGLLGAADGTLFVAVGSEPFLIASTDEATSWQSIAEGLPEPPVGLAVAPPWLLALLGDGRLWRAPLVPIEHRVVYLLDLSVEQGPSATVFAFELRQASAATLTVHDVLGKEVACLATGWFNAGQHRIHLPAGTLPPGFYQCRLRAGEASRTAPLVMMG